MIRCLALVALLGACKLSGAFSCERDEQCRLAGEIGRCESSGFCSFVDGSCASGSRYDSLAGGGLAGRCVGDPATIDAGIDGPPGDPDNDGIASDLDNCPTIANPDQHDEDGDQKGDLCDPCPQLASPADDVDSDGDGIGDGCDPRPALPGDVLVMFEPFATGTGLPLGWTAIDGNANDWSVANDALVNTALGAINMVMFDVASGNRTIDVVLDVTATNGGPDTVGAGALIDGNGTQGSFYLCFIRTIATPAVFNQNIGSGGTNLASAGTPTLPGRYRVQTSYDGANLRCHFDGTGAPADLVTTQPSLSGTRAGLRLRNAAARVEYVAVYSSP